MKLFRPQATHLVAAIAAMLFSLDGTAEAGLQGALQTLFDRLEASNPVRDFVPPATGSDVRPLCVGAECPDGPPDPLPGPALHYDWNTGNLSATIPAALLNIAPPGSRFYQKIYTLADLAIDSRMLHDDVVSNSTVFGWQPGAGPLEVIPSTSQTLRSATSLIWKPIGWNIPPISTPPNGPVAAVVDFGSALPSGLSRAELDQAIFPDPSLNFVEYFNHRGLISFRAPLLIEMTPEPSALAELVIGLTLALLMEAGHRRPIR